MSFLCCFFSHQKELLNSQNRMCAYKLVTVNFKWWGLQKRVENLIHEVRVIDLQDNFSVLAHALYSAIQQYVD